MKMSKDRTERWYQNPAPEGADGRNSVVSEFSRKTKYGVFAEVWSPKDIKKTKIPKRKKIKHPAPTQGR